MKDEKFNPIANLPPTLPGAEIVDDVEPYTVDPKIQPTETKEAEHKSPQIEIRMKPPAAEEEEDQTVEGKRLTIIRIAVLVSLIVLVLAGILLTIAVVPKIMSGVSNFNRSISAFLTPQNKTTSTTVTSNKVPAYIPLVATSTISSNKPVVTTSTSTEKIAKTPASLVSSIVSTNSVYGRTTIKFNIQNVGDSTSGRWSFSVKLPSSVTPVYYSAEQSALAPQSGVIYTLGFTPDQYNNSAVQITIYK